MLFRKKWRSWKTLYGYQYCTCSDSERSDLEYEPKTKDEYLTSYVK